MSVDTCNSITYDVLVAKLQKDSSGKIVMGANNVPRVLKSGSTTEYVDIYGDDLACWMSVELANKQLPGVPPTPVSVPAAYAEMYDNTLLAGLMWAILGGTLLYYTVAGSSQ